MDRYVERLAALDNKINALIKEFPRVFPSYPYCGASVRDGWVPIIRELCEQIDAYLKANPETEFSVAQIKEKFGGLRFYYDPHNDEINELVGAAKKKCQTVCEMCGTPDNLGTQGYYTRCKDCQEKVLEG